MNSSTSARIKLLWQAYCRSVMEAFRHRHEYGPNNECECGKWCGN